MTVFYDNPAGRLHRILKGLKDLNAPSMGILEAWARVLRVSDHAQHMDVLSRRIVAVYQLPPAIDFEMQQIDDEHFDRDFGMRWWQPVDRTLANALFSSAQVSQIVQYDNETLASLENCSYMLHRYRHEALPVESDLDAILQLLAEIEEVIAAGKLDPDLGDFLSLHVRAMKIAIGDFQITGAPGIQEALDRAVGASILHKYFPPGDVSEDEPESESESSRAIASFWKMLSRVAMILSIAGNLLAIGHATYSSLT